MLPFDPFAWFYSFVGFLQEQWGRFAQAISHRIQETRLFRKVHDLFLNVPISSEERDAPELQEPSESSISERTTSFFQFVLHICIIQPFYAFIGLLGLSFEWLVSRQWLAITILSLPAALLVISAASTWFAGRFDRTQLSAHYFKLGVAELERVAESSATEGQAARTGQENARPVSQTQEMDPVSANGIKQSNGSDRFRYAELLFNRSLVLQANNNWRYLLGATLLDNAAHEGGRKMLRRIAPDTGQGIPAAHAAVATSILNQFNSRGDQELMTPFLHHAKIGLVWRGTPKEVLLALSGAYWQRGAQEDSLNVLTIAAERFEGLYTTVFQRAAAVGNQKIAEELKPKAIAELETNLAKDPSNSKFRVLLVQLYDTDKAGLAQAEEKIREGIAIKPDPLLSRALSEIYRIAFVRRLMESQQALADFNLLEIAFQADPSNPLVTEQIANLVSQHQGSTEELSKGLYGILASGAATGCVHAILAEIQLRSERPNAAQNHLEQVYQRAPQAAKYTNRLALMYVENQRTEEAVKICIESLSILDQSGLLKERYVDELLHTAGVLFLQLGRSTDAESALENALKAKPDRQNTRLALIRHYRSIGKEQEAAVHEQYLNNIKDRTGDAEPSTPDP